MSGSRTPPCIAKILSLPPMGSRQRVRDAVVAGPSLTRTTCSMSSGHLVRVTDGRGPGSTVSKHMTLARDVVPREPTGFPDAVIGLRYTPGVRRGVDHHDVDDSPLGRAAVATLGGHGLRSVRPIGPNTSGLHCGLAGVPTRAHRPRIPAKNGRAGGGVFSITASGPRQGHRRVKSGCSRSG